MRLHIELDDDLVDEIDSFAGPRGRSRFIREAILSTLRHRKQRHLIDAARGSIAGEGHDWDEDPAEWVRAQRTGDPRKVG